MIQSRAFVAFFAALMVFSMGLLAKDKPVPIDSNQAKQGGFYNLFDGHADFDFSGQASPAGCSGSVVHFGQALTAKAIMLTNAHCVGMLSAPQGTTHLNHPYATKVRLFRDRTSTITANSTKIIYGVIHQYDMALVELDLTYAELLSKGVRSRKISSSPINVGEMVVMPSGYFRTVTTCPILGVVPTILEDIYQNANSYKYKDCNSIHGTSGSPLIHSITGEVVGLNYTGNDDGEACTYNNPCEVDENGVITAEKGMSYGDPVHEIMTCLDANKNFNYNAPGCLLPR